MLDLCLVAMPYGHLHMPSLGVGLLVAGARQAGLNAHDVHPRFWFAEQIGLKRYAALSSAPTSLLLGEMTFSAAAFPGFEPDYEQGLREKQHECPQTVSRLCSLLDDRTLLPTIDDILPILQELREAAVRFIEEAAQRILGLDPAVVGCSSSFEQHCASLGLLRRIKEQSPTVTTLIGGANCEGVMGQTAARVFPWIDYAISGEADLVLPELCKMLIENGGIPPRELPNGVFCRENVGSSPPGKPPAATVVDNLDDLPLPDYRGYFEELDAFSDADKVRPMLPMESSRGCWWSRRKNGGCRFCGQNGGRQCFRAKSPERIYAQLKAIQHGDTRAKVVHMADTNFPPSYFRFLLPKLSENATPDFTLFWEMLPTAGRARMTMLSSANVRVILAGIESLHDGALELMNKGTSAIGNVAFLKYAMEQGCLVLWNLLHRIPGEDPQWYAEMASWLPLIYHLQPPTKLVPIRFHRFSEYHRDPATYGLDLTPNSAYGSYVYPLLPNEIEGLAYLFDDTSSPRSEVGAEPQLELIRDAVHRWNLRFAHNTGGAKRTTLTVHHAAAESHITDTRACAAEEHATLTGRAHFIYRECGVPRTSESLSLALRRNAGIEASPNAIANIVDDLIHKKLLLDLGGRFLSLALVEPVRPLPTPDELSWGYVIDGKTVL